MSLGWALLHSLGGGSLLQPSFSCGHIPGVSLGQPRSFFHTLVPAPAGSGEGERAVSMATSLFVISYFLFYGFSNFEALQTVYRLWKGKVPSLPQPPRPSLPQPPRPPLPQHPQASPPPAPQASPPSAPPGLPSPSPPGLPYLSPQAFPPPAPRASPLPFPPRLSLPQGPTRHLKPSEAPLFLKHLEKMNAFSPKTMQAREFTRRLSHVA